MQKTLTFAMLAAILALSACNSGSDIDRAIIGGAIGCAAGELYEDGECITGAAIGAGAGALADNI